MDPLEYFKENFEYFKNEVAKLISFKSISTDPEFKEEVEHAYNWVKEKFESLGFSVTVLHTKSNPIIFAEYIEDPKLKTILLYGHYDVQPVEPIADWLSDPFELTEKDGKFFARGIMDNKGQFMMHVCAIESILKTKGKLPVNIKFLIEGDEETGSDDLDRVLRENTDLLGSDVGLISDGMILGDDVPVIEAGFRGVLNVELTVTNAKEDLHSGEYGGTIANPAYELSKLLSKLYDEDYKITIPHFYDEVNEVTSEEKEVIETRKEYEEEFLKTIDVKNPIGEKGYSTFERNGLRPTVQITGFGAGYNGAGYRNIVPAKASVKINFRLVEKQNPEKIYENLKKFIDENISKNVKYELSDGDMVEAVKIDINNQYLGLAREILERVYGNKPIVVFIGGTLPIINSIKDITSIPILAVPLSQEDAGIHSANERLTINAFNKGVEFSIKFLGEF